MARELRREVENSGDSASHTMGRATGTRTAVSAEHSTQRTRLPKAPIGGLKEESKGLPGVTNVRTSGDRVGEEIPGINHVVRRPDGSYVYRSSEDFATSIRGAREASRLVGKPISIIDPGSPARGVTIEVPTQGEVIVRVDQGRGAKVAEWLRDGRYSTKDQVTVVEAGKTVGVFSPATVAEQAALKSTWSQIAELTKAGKLGDGKPFVDGPRPGFHDEWTTLHPTKRVPGALADWVIGKRVQFLQRTGQLPADLAGEWETKQKLLGPVREHIEYGKPIDESFLQNEIDKAFVAPKTGV